MTVAGHNSKLTEAESQALWGHHARQRVAIYHAEQELKDRKDKLKADAKNDGIPEKDLKDLIELTFTTDKQKKVDEFNRRKRIMINTGLIADDRQGDLLADRASKLEMIYAEGFQAGLAALDRVSKQNGASDEDREWLRGYDDAQKVMLENLKTAMEKRNADKSKEEPPATTTDGDDPFTLNQEK
ncbi:hypothetical protein [Agrobacterium rubi]|uniref:hypothetical protein n=1 Tax=Agrobacterium rubi TaxID=28099 RepID=UPI001572EE2A|nr:hypothetical protein [Agrobacterium rubi]NTE87228.1 hypothetical protein [Agrobacterium rubi]NTF03162.1 hypothetical protein [Agrobacterium rubi]